MNMSLLYVMPLVAFILCMTIPVVSGDPKKLYRSKRSSRRFKNRLLIARWLVVALLLSTIITKLKPLAAMPPALQGLVLLGFLCAPLLPLLFGLSLWRRYSDSLEQKRTPAEESSINAEYLTQALKQKSNESGNSAHNGHSTLDPGAASQTQKKQNNAASMQRPSVELSAENGKQSFTDLAAVASKAKIAPAETQHNSIQAPTASVNLNADEHPDNKLEETLADQTLDGTYLAEADQTMDASSFLDQTLNASDLLDQTVNAETALDPDSTVSVHMQNFDTAHDYHDVGVDDKLAQKLATKSPSDKIPEKTMESSPVDTAIALAKREFAEKQNAKSAEPNQYLSTTSATELKQLVSALQSDKTKLQKLVIAQQAVISSERDSHAKTRTLAKDAVKIMRNARESQKAAEKLARRERAKRLRIQDEYMKTRSALKNALSVSRRVKEKVN